MINRRAPPRDASKLDHWLLAAGAHVSREFSKRSFLLALATAEKPFEHNLSIGRNLKIDCLALNQRHGFTAQPAGDRKLIGAVAKLADRCEHAGRIYADRNCHRHV